MNEHLMYSVANWKLISRNSVLHKMHSEIPFTQIFREINFRNCRGLKSATLTHLEDLNFGFYEFLHVLKGEISPNQKLRASEWQKWHFMNFCILQNWFNVKSGWQKMLKFPHCVMIKYFLFHSVDFFSWNGTTKIYSWQHWFSNITNLE